MDFLHGRRPTQHGTPGGVDVDVAGHAGAIAAASGFAPGHAGAERRLHERYPDPDRDPQARAVGLDEGDGGRRRDVRHARRGEANRTTPTPMALMIIMLTHM